MPGSDEVPDGKYTLLNMLEKENLGLNHVRELVLQDELEYERDLEEIHCYPDAALFAHLLPLNTLRTFHDAMPKAACELLQQHREIRHLALDLFCMSDGEHEEDKPCQSMYAINTLFAGFKLSPLCLVTLHLDRANLKLSQRDLISALELGVLKNLNVVQCKHADKFLAALSRAIQESPMHLERLIIYQAEIWDADMDPEMNTNVNPVIKALNTLLKSKMGSLQELWICLRGFHHLPNAASVAQHGSTLKWLFLDVRKGTDLCAITYPLAEWKILCESLRALEQLDAAYPSIVADGSINTHPDFLEYIKQTTKMVKLRILGLNDCPVRLRTDPQHQNLNRRLWGDPIYRPMMAELATNILLILTQRRHMMTSLKIITFGVAKQVETDIWSEVKQMLFAKSHLKVLDGEEKMRMEHFYLDGFSSASAG
ncbi:MAG: hypothetical protein Q9199_006969 [Rusavskia elegans]